MEKGKKYKTEEFRKKINDLIIDSDDNFLLGYSEAILNLLGEFSNGQCAFLFHMNRNIIVQILTI